MSKESPPLTSSPEVRLLPLVTDSSNEALANLLARLLIEDESQAELGVRSALMILTGIQVFLDSGGKYEAIEQLWEPIIVHRQLQKDFGAKAPQKAGELAQIAHQNGDLRGAAIYDRVMTLLNKQVDTTK